MLYAYLEQRIVKRYWSNFRLKGAVSPFEFCLDECNIITSMSFFGKDWRQCAIHNAQGAAWYMLAKSSLRKFPFFSFLLAIPEHSYAQQVRKCTGYKANQFCGIPQGGGRFMKGQIFHPPECSTELRRKPVRVSQKHATSATISPTRMNFSWTSKHSFLRNPNGFPLWLRATLGWMTIFPFHSRLWKCTTTLGSRNSINLVIMKTRNMGHVTCLCRLRKCMWPVLMSCITL